MSKKSADELADLLLQINEGTVDDKTAREILEGISEVELSLAEQRLLERGITPETLQNLCRVHLKVIETRVQQTKEAAGPGHPIHTLMAEHEKILGFLDSLENSARIIASHPFNTWDSALQVALEDLRKAAHHLVETEKHHQREEEALFPALEERGITGPTRIMRLEHGNLRPTKASILKLGQEAFQMNPRTFSARIAPLVSYLVPTLREHIFKEDSILYPAALEAIRDPETWKDIKKRCDEIGYCCFTPLHEGRKVKSRWQ